MINVPHILLAAGASKRMGEPKQLLWWGNKRLIQFQIENILNTTKKLFVILGAHADLIEPYLIKYDIELIRFNEWESGMGDSLAFGVKYIKNSLSNLDGILISLIDQPLILTSHYLKMRKFFEKDKKQIIASESEVGWAGVPILFDVFYFDQIMALTGEKGARVILKKNMENAILINAGNSLIDMDTPNIYKKLFSKFSPR